MLRKAYLVVPLFLVFASSALSADSGTLIFRARDVLTGYAVKATLQLEGPASLTLEADGNGYASPSWRQRTAGKNGIAR